MLETIDLGFEIVESKALGGNRSLLLSFLAVIGGGPDAGLAEGLIDVEARVEIGLEIAEDRDWTRLLGALQMTLSRRPAPVRRKRRGTRRATSDRRCSRPKPARPRGR